MTMSDSSSKALVPARRRPDRADPTLPAILEFQWPSTAIANAAIPRSARGMVWVIGSMVVALIVAMGLIPVDQVVAARGLVVPTAQTIMVQPLETAIVRSLDVKEGQQVHAGDILAQLDPTFAAADLTGLTAQVASLEAEVARLTAESDGKPFVLIDGDREMSPPIANASTPPRRSSGCARSSNQYRWAAN